MTLGFASMYAGLAHLRRVATVLSVDPAAIATAIRRSGDRNRLEHLAAELRREGASWEADLLDAMRVPGERARAAMVNEQLDDLSRQLRSGSDLPAKLGRISMTWALAFILISVAGGYFSPEILLMAAGWGGAGILVALAAGRESQRVVESVRKGVDTLLEHGLAVLAEVEDPSQTTRGGVDSGDAGV